MTPVKFSPSHESPFLDANRFLGSRKNQALRNHTSLVRRDSAIAVKYHDTDIVTYNQDGTIVLDNGGWYTTSTCERVTLYNPLGYVCIVQGTWWYHPAEKGLTERTAYEYENGMTLQPDGIPDTRLREVVLLESIANIQSMTFDQAVEYVAGLELKEIKRLVRNPHLRYFALENCKKEFVPAFIGREDMAEIIERRLKV
jgi:hypothetical protein